MSWLYCHRVMRSVGAPAGRCACDVDPARRPVRRTRHRCSRAPPAPRAPLDQSALLSQVVPGLVDINTSLSYQGAVGNGTGIVIDPSGEVLTNNHVIEGATEITALSLANSVSYAVDVIGFDRASGIALIRLRGAGGLPTANLGTSSSVAVGDRSRPSAAQRSGRPAVLRPGCGDPARCQRPRLRRVRRRFAGLYDLIRVAANIRPGDSGGPLVNSAGQVVGVTVAAT